MKEYREEQWRPGTNSGDGAEKGKGKKKNGARIRPRTREPASSMDGGASCLRPCLQAMTGCPAGLAGWVWPARCCETVAGGPFPATMREGAPAACAQARQGSRVCVVPMCGCGVGVGVSHSVGRRLMSYQTAPTSGFLGGNSASLAVSPFTRRDIVPSLLSGKAVQTCPYSTHSPPPPAN